MFSSGEWLVFRIGFAASLIAKAVSALPGAFSVDDILWSNTAFNGALVEGVATRDGRFLYPYLADVVYSLGIDAPQATTLSAVVLMLSLVFAAQLMCRIWRIENNLAACVCVVLITTLHPYQVDLFTWKIGMLTGGLPFLASMWGLWAASKWRRGVIAGAITIAASLAIHQIAITWIAVAFCFSAIFVALDENAPFRRACMARGVPGQLIAIVGGVIIYLALVVLGRPIWGTVAQAQLYGLSQFQLVSQFQTFLELLLFHNPLFSPLLDAGCCFLIAAFSYKVISVRRPQGSRLVNRIALVAVFMALAWVLCIVLPVITLQKGQMFARTMSAFGLFWGGIAGVTVFYATKAFERKIYVTIVALISVGFIGVNNQALSDQLRANRRDTEIAKDIARKVEDMEGSQYVDRLAIIGSTARAITNLRTGLDLSERQKQLGIVMSVFATQYDNDYRVRLINETTASSYIGKLSQDEQKQAREYCRYALKASGQFPAYGSVVRSGPMAIVCLGNQRVTP